MYLVLTQKWSGSEYKDEVGVRYHYPKRYAGVINPGDRFVYYHSRQGLGAGTQERYYFGTGTIGDIWEDPQQAGHIYAEVLDYKPFPHHVLLHTSEGGYYESLGRPADSPPNFRSAVRRISQSGFDAILAVAGAAEVDAVSVQRRVKRTETAAGRNPDWTRDELILALDLYFRHRPAHPAKSHPEITELSRLLKSFSIHKERPDPESFRNPNGVYMKLSNFLRLDPEYGGKGLGAGSKLEEVIWEEFVNDRGRLHALAAAIRVGAEVAATSEGTEQSSEDQDDEAPEGKILARLHRIRERNPGLVKKKKQLVLKKTGVLECEVCGFVFSQHYGKWGEGFIECHHTIPVSQLTPGDKTHLKDLAVVCANCHRMLHRGGALLTVDHLRAIYQ